MKTKLLKGDKEGILEAAFLLQQGELVAFPTETVYGLGASIFQEKAIAKIFEAKKRPADNPLIAHLSDLNQVEQIAEDLPPFFYRLAERFFPGPLTIVLKKRKNVPAIVSAGGATIALRMPDHAIAHQLIQRVGSALVAPSANLSGKPSSTDASHVLHDFDGKIAAIIDGGRCEIGIESTVLSLVGDEPLLMRLGKVTKEEIEAFFGRKILVATVKASDKPLSPGMKYRHYAPEATLLLFESEKEAHSYSQGSQARCRIITPTAYSLYADFREADQDGIEKLLIVCGEDLKKDAALFNRLKIASSTKN